MTELTFSLCSHRRWWATSMGKNARSRISVTCSNRQGGDSALYNMTRHQWLGSRMWLPFRSKVVVCQDISEGCYGYAVYVVKSYESNINVISSARIMTPILSDRTRDDEWTAPRSRCQSWTDNWTSPPRVWSSNLARLIRGRRPYNVPQYRENCCERMTREGPK